MRSGELKKQVQIIEDLIKRTAIASASEIELQSHWAKYICVLCAGFLENAITETYGEFSQRRSNIEVANFVNRQLGRIKNVNADKFIQTAYLFKKSWGEDLDVFLSTDGRKDAIDSIIDNRNKISHGDYSGITIHRIREYFGKAVEVVEFIETQCNI